MTGRTLQRWARIYVDGYDLSGHARQLGELSEEWDCETDATLPETVKGGLIGQGALNIGTVNVILSQGVAGDVHAVMSGAGVSRTVLIALGQRGAPTVGDPAFMGKFCQSGYSVSPPESGMVTVGIPFAKTPVDLGMNYDHGFGVLLAPSAARTSANTSTGYDGGAATTKGGFMVWQLLACSGTGNITMSIDDSADNSTWLALSGATSGAIAHTAVGSAGLVQLATTATVRRYLRWQLALSGVTSATFVLGFVRG